MITERLLKVALLGSAWVLYVLLALSILSISVMVERWLFFRRFRDDVGTLRHRVVEALLRGDTSRPRPCWRRARRWRRGPSRSD